MRVFKVSDIMEAEEQIYEVSERKAGTERSDIPEGFPKRTSNICFCWSTGANLKTRIARFDRHILRSQY
jgi:hypothetical protein